MSADLSVSFKEKRRQTRRDWLRSFLLPRISRTITVGTEPILVFAPHQDDETLGCGGLIALKRRAEIPVIVVFVTDGGGSHGKLDDTAKADLITKRQIEATAALNILGVETAAIRFLGLPDGGLSTLDQAQTAEATAQIAEIIDRFSDATIYLPHRRDSHPDHEAVNRLVRAAITLSTKRQTEKPIRIYEYPVWLFWSRNRLFDTLKLNDLRGTKRLNIQSVLTQKTEAMRKHQTQLPLLPPGFVDFFMTNEEIYFHTDG